MTTLTSTTTAAGLHQRFYRTRPADWDTTELTTLNGMPFTPIVTYVDRNLSGSVDLDLILNGVQVRMTIPADTPLTTQRELP